MKRPSGGVLIGILMVAGLAALIAFRLIQATGAREAVPTVEQIREARGVPVAVAPARRGTLEVWREFSGTVAGTREGIVRARSREEIAAVTVEVGQRVRRGQVLVRQAGEATEARVRQAETSRRQAERTVERLRPLYEAGALSEQEWERALTDLELATAELAATQDALVLTSPLDGVVTEVIARPGMIPAVDDALVRVADLSRLMVSLRVSADEVALIREGQPARAAAAAEAGRVRRIALQADPATRLVEVEVEFPAGARLIPGTLATLEIRVASREDAVHVPRAAVRDGVVWVIDGESRAVRRDVTAGLQSRGDIEILDGVAEGDRVVVEGASLLTEGALVRLAGAQTEDD